MHSLVVSIPWHCNLLNLILYEDLVDYIGEILHTCFELQVSHIECCSLAQTRLLEMCYIRYLIKGITCPLICFLLFNIIGATATFRPLDF